MLFMSFMVELFLVCAIGPLVFLASVRKGFGVCDWVN